MNSQTSSIIKLATSVAEIEQCFPVMSQLRPHLPADNFVQQVQTQMTTGYQLAYIKDLKDLEVVIGLSPHPSSLIPHPSKNGGCLILMILAGFPTAVA